MSVKIYNGIEYNLAHKHIVCRADMDGAEVFEISGELGKKRILAHSEELAYETYQSELENDWRYCSFCDSIYCNCDVDDED